MQKQKSEPGFNGSITVEAALVVPLFIFVIIGIIYINQLLYRQEQVQCALETAAKQTSLEYALSGKKMAVNPAVMTAKINAFVSGRSDANASIIGITKSKIYEDTDQMEFVAGYTITSPIPVFMKRIFCFNEKYYGRAFTGVLTRMTSSEQKEDQMVYVTKTGKVYHETLTCHHLKLGLQQVFIKELEKRRSEDGHIYYPCEKCCAGKELPDSQVVVICNYGSRYHVQKNCQKISRSIREIPISQVEGRTPCKTCVKGKEMSSG